MNEINIGKNITKFRRSKGITQGELASYIGVSKSSVSKWENNANSSGYEGLKYCGKSLPISIFIVISPY